MPDEEYRVRQIPDNFGSGINILGRHYASIFVVEGIAFAVIFIAICVIVMRAMGICEIEKIIGASLFFAVPALIFGVHGINDEPITTFIASAFRFGRNKRTAYYNPRVKFEAQSVLTDSGLEVKDAARERIMDALGKYKSEKDKKQQEKVRSASTENDFIEGSMQFEDDLQLKKHHRKK